MVEGILFVFIITCCVWYSDCAVTCLNDQGKSVDWFIAYKLPKISDHPNPLVRAGLGHFYMDVNTQTWSLSDISVNSSHQAIYNTLQQIYKNSGSDSVAYFLYNDQKPGHKGSSLKHGHTKGNACLDKESGFWLVHSTPHFPPPAHQGYSYPHTGLLFGQSFLCVTYSFKVFNTIGSQITYNYPWIYDKNIPPFFSESLPDLANAMKGSKIQQPPWNKSVTVQSVGGQAFTIFSKASQFNRDLYHDWLAPSLKSDLDTETWQNGEGRLASNCSGLYKVKNNIQLSFPDSNVYFKSTHDHSKWAVTTSKGKNWVCIGDINRQQHQFVRGGGTVCLDLGKVWSTFKGLITSEEECKSSYNQLLVQSIFNGSPDELMDDNIL